MFCSLMSYAKKDSAADAEPCGSFSKCIDR